jgi:hypothetical protein
MWRGWICPLSRRSREPDRTNHSLLLCRDAAELARSDEPVSFPPQEPTLEEILSDPIVMALMAADGVDPQELEAKLRLIASTSTYDRRSCAGTSSFSILSRPSAKGAERPSFAQAITEAAVSRAFPKQSESQ